MTNIQEIVTRETSGWTLCHCEKRYWNKLDHCPFCYCAKDKEQTCSSGPVVTFSPAVEIAVETKPQRVARLERQGCIVRGCKGCEVLFENPDTMAPRHKPSERCKSGKRPHCTCDTCF